VAPGTSTLGNNRYPRTVSELAPRLAVLRQEFEDVESSLGDPELIADQKRFQDVNRRYTRLRQLVTVWDKFEAASEDIEVAREMLGEADGEDADDLREEIVTLEAIILRAEDEVRILLLPTDPNDGKNVIIEIRGAEGGEEANLFARDLYDMYTSWGKSLGWKYEGLSASESAMGGFDNVTFMFKGPDVWTRMRFEGGTHRVQRVPATETQGRVHTSSATITVLPEAEEVDVEINENDLQIDVYRSSGPGGQSVNTTDSAVRITHKPTGIMVAMQDEKSQIQNRAKAMRVLRARMLKAEQDKQAAELSDARRSQVGGGGRGEKIRTFNFKENRVTDHRIGLTIYKLDKIMNGDLTDINDAMMQDLRERQLRDEADS